MTESSAELPGSGHGSLPFFIFVGESEKQSRILVPHLSLVCMEICCHKKHDKTALSQSGSGI